MKQTKLQLINQRMRQQRNARRVWHMSDRYRSLQRSERDSSQFLLESRERFRLSGKGSHMCLLRNGFDRIIARKPLRALRFLEGGFELEFERIIIMKCVYF